MRNRLICFLLLFALISSYCSSYIDSIAFKINKEYIAENLCVNKSSPWMNCNGRCYLMKKLKQTQEKEKKQQQQEQKSRYQETLPSKSVTLTFTGTLIKKEYSASLTPGLPFQPSFAVFQPPRV